MSLVEQQQQPPITTTPPTRAQGGAGGEDPNDETVTDDEQPQNVRTLGRGGPMSDQAISDRVARERRKVLREEYGTDDPDKIASIKAERAKTNEEFKTRQEELDRLKKEKEDEEEKNR